MILLEEFQAGHLEQGVGYKYFVPSNIYDEWSWKTASVNTLLEAAAIKLGELNSFARLVPNIALFIRLHVTKEAVISSRIEGTKTQLDEGLAGGKQLHYGNERGYREPKRATYFLSTDKKHSPITVKQRTRRT